jgi:hypothetical protein
MGLFGFGKSKGEKEEVTQLILAQYQEINQAITGDLHPFNALVRFFNGTSKLQDNIELIKQVVLRSATSKNKKEAENLMRILVNELNKCGRARFGWNRTDHGETVTEDNIFIDPHMGHNTLTPTQLRAKGWDNEKKHSTYGGRDLNFNPYTHAARNFYMSYNELPSTLQGILKILGTNV